MADPTVLEPENTHVTVVCQRCSQPIKLNHTLKASQLASMTRTKDTESHPPKPRPVSTSEEENLLRGISEDINSVTKSFKVLSSHSEVDHPLCQFCPDAALEQYKEEIREAEEAHQKYESFIFEMKEREKEDKENEEKIDQELTSLKEEEKRLMAELDELRGSLHSVSEELEKQKVREKELDKEERAYWREFNEHQRKVLELRDENDGMEQQLQYTIDQLSKLKRTSVLNTAFHIWHNGHFATINGLRFGKLPNVPVEWAEINAAWGQTAFLLSTLASLCGCSFTRYTLIPYGSQSFIQDSEGKKKQLPLYTGSRLFSDSRFDTAMVAFLDCLSQFKRHVESASDGRFLLPYIIDKDCIGDGKEYFSIKMQFNTEEKWTKALKFVLTNLRWGMTWVSANLLNNDAGVSSVDMIDK